LEATDKSIPGGFEEQWAKFALRNWNQAPVEDYVDSYKQVDGLTVGAMSSVEVVQLPGITEQDFILDVDLPHLSAKYYRITFPDDSTHLVTFFNGLTFKLFLKERSVWGMPVGETAALEAVTEDQKKGAHVQALVKIGGKWNDMEDWTDKPYRTYCRDKASERIEELVIIFSSSAYQPRNYVIKPQGLDPMVFASNIGCWQWEGTANTVNGESNYETLTTISEVVWERVPTEDAPDDGLLFEPYLTFQPLSGQVDWTASGTNGECTGSGGDRFLLGRGTGVGGLLQLYPYGLPGPHWREAFGLGPYGGQFTETCPDGTHEPIFLDFWFGFAAQQISIDGAAIHYEAVTEEDYMKVDFKAQSQP
jgi:hypothetical protein